jgi:pimeloyl-ACP methyl ester carboxylesterase
VIFLHGYGESLLTWRYILDRFTGKYRVLAIDLPGFGQSDALDGDHDFESYERCLGDLIQSRTKGPIIVVGHSMGGQLAAGLALKHPDRVVAAVLIAPAGAGLNPLLTDTNGVASSAVRWVVPAVSLALPTHDHAWLDEAPADLQRDSAADSVARIARQRVLTEFDFAALDGRFDSLRQPVLLLWGRQDPTIPFEIGEGIAAELPCRRFVAITTLHRPHQTQPDTVAAEMARFLARPACEGGTGR